MSVRAAARRAAKTLQSCDLTVNRGKPPRVGVLVTGYHNKLLQIQTHKENAAPVCVENLSKLLVFYFENGLSTIDLRLNFAGDPSFLSATFDKAKFKQVLSFLRELCLDDTDAVRKIVRKFPGIFDHDPARLRKTAECLQNLGLDRKMLVSNPKVLCMDDIEAKVELLLSHGISREALGRLSNRWHCLLTSSLKGNLKPKLDKLAELSIRGKFLERLVAKYPWVLSSHNAEIEANASAFKEAGIEGQDFARMVSWAPLAIKAAGSLTARAEFLIQAGLEKDSDVFISALGVVSALNEATLKARLDRFSGYGFSKLETQEMIKKQPRILVLSDEFLDKKMRFLQRCVKLPKSHLLGSPNYLLYSLEKRLVPRFRVVASLRCNGLMSGRNLWKQVFYDSDATFRERIAMFHPEALAVLEAVIQS